MPRVGLTTNQVLKMVKDTNGYEVDHRGTEATVTRLATSTEPRGSLLMHTSDFHGAVRQSDITRLKRIGWTMALYRAQDPVDREERKEKAARVESRINLFIDEQGGYYKTPAPPKREDRMKEITTGSDVVLTGQIVTEFRDPESGEWFRREVVTPDRAEEWIDNIPRDKNEDGKRSQRPASIPRSQLYAEKMLRGEWKVIPSPIVISINEETGEEYVSDGLRRCTAVRICSLEQVFWVARGFPADTFLAIDKGQARTIAHSLWVEGYSDPAVLGSVTAFLAKVDTGKPLTLWRSMTLSDEQILKYLEGNPEVVESMPMGKITRLIKANRAGLIAAHYLIRRQARNDQAVERWFDQFYSGEMLQRGDPLMALRDWFQLQDKMTTKVKGAPDARILHAGQIIRAWNMDQAGEKKVSMSFVTPYTWPTPSKYVPKRSPAIEAVFSTPFDHQPTLELEAATD